MFGALDVSTSALAAQRTRLDIISGNLAHQFSTHDAEGNYNPYQRRVPIFAPGDPATGRAEGVHVQEIRLDPSPPRLVYEPNHPDADENGYVGYPNIDPAIEMTNALEASRAYEANITAAETTKSMMQAAIGLLA